MRTVKIRHQRSVAEDFEQTLKRWEGLRVCMQVGIIGSGDVGLALGRGFVEHNYNVMIGTHSPDKESIQAWLAEVGDAGSVGSFQQAADYGEIVVVALKGDIVEETLANLDGASFSGKVVIDVTNPLDFSHGMPPGLFTGLSDSLGEHLQRILSEARVVKCWNIVPNSLMAHPSIGGTSPTMMICGNDASAKETVQGILQEFGWDDVVDIGGIAEAGYLEALVALWVRVTTAKGTWNVAFKVLIG